LFDEIHWNGSTGDSSNPLRWNIEIPNEVRKFFEFPAPKGK
jgi:hypothetical protein